MLVGDLRGADPRSGGRWYLTLTLRRGHGDGKQPPRRDVGSARHRAASALRNADVTVAGALHTVSYFPFGDRIAHVNAGYRLGYRSGSRV